MRLMTIARLFAVSVVLLGGAPAFAARAVQPGTRAICSEQVAGLCHLFPFNPRTSGATGNPQARANAASKTWPGDMVLD
jgi:hypothetical protein